MPCLPLFRTFATLAILFVALIAEIPAGEHNPVLSVGDAAPAWVDLPGVDGKKHSLADLKGKEIVILVFTCNSCPVATDYEDRILSMARKYAGPEGRAALVAINVNRIPEDRLPKMEERAKERGFTFPYLYDESQKIARDYGATFTPEFFVLDKDRKIAYMGGMDDNSYEAKVTARHLEPAIEAILRGEKPAAGETVARGCMIRYARQRK
jgi:peroxiredoxin